MKDQMVLLEFIDEFDSFLRYCGQRGESADDYLVIALDLKLESYLKKKNVPFVNSLKYFNNRSHERTLLKSEEIVHLLSENKGLLSGLELQTYKRTLIFNTRLMINHILYLIEIYKGILENENCKTVLSCEFSQGLADTPFIENSDRYVGRLAREFFTGKGIPFEGIPCPAAGTASVRTGKREARIGFKYAMIARLYTLLFSMVNGEKVLVGPLEYNMQRFITQLQERFDSINYFAMRTSLQSAAIEFVKFTANWLGLIRRGKFIFDIPVNIFSSIVTVTESDTECFANAIDEASRLILEDQRAVFAYEGVEFSDMVADKIMRGMKPSLQQIQESVECLKVLFQKIRPRLIVSQFSRDIFSALGELSRTYNVPALVVPHGTVVPPNNRLEEIENFHLGLITDSYAYALAQTPWVHKFCSHYGMKNTIVNSNPIIFARKDKTNKYKIKRRILKNVEANTVILHATTQKPRSAVKFNIIETGDEFISSLTDLVESINRMEYAVLVIKPHPSLGLTEGELWEMLPQSDKVIIAKDESFEELLAVTDLLISYSSSTIEEALQNEIPVLLYDKWDRYKHFDAETLSKDVEPEISAVYYIKDRNYLDKGLRWILKTHDKLDIPKEVFSKYVFAEDKKEELFEFVSNRLKSESEVSSVR